MSAPFHKGLILLGLREFGVRDSAEASLAALQAAKLDLDGNASFARPLDIRARDFNVLLVDLSGWISGTGLG